MNDQTEIFPTESFLNTYVIYPQDTVHVSYVTVQPVLEDIVPHVSSMITDLNGTHATVELENALKNPIYVVVDNSKLIIKDEE